MWRFGAATPTGPNLYAKARYYDSEYGRFTTQDSYLGEIDTPPSLHRYLYAASRPTFFVDPTGNESVVPHLREKENLGEIAKFSKDEFKAEPSRFSDELTDEEEAYLDFYAEKFDRKRHDAATLTDEQVQQAERLFAGAENPREAFANWSNRKLIITNYALTSPEAIAYLDSLYAVSRDLNPSHFMAERSQQVLTGEEAFTGRKTGRARPAAELATVWLFGKLTGYLFGKATEPSLPRAEGLSGRIGSGSRSGSSRARTQGTQARGRANLAGQRHQRSGVEFDAEGFPVFQSRFDVKIPGQLNSPKVSDTRQFSAATRELRAAIRENPEMARQFTSDQLKAIESGQPRIPGYTWHHNQDGATLQLVERTPHRQTGHAGGRQATGGRPR